MSLDFCRPSLRTHSFFTLFKYPIWDIQKDKKLRGEFLKKWLTPPNFCKQKLFFRTVFRSTQTATPFGNGKNIFSFVEYKKCFFKGGTPMRKAYYVRLSQVKDEQAYSLLLNCRHCTHDQLREYISENRVKSYMKAKLIEKISTQQGTVYRLTEKG